jgi:1-acyl-sn-glycerol-3-phosphate acyltransferase
MLLFRFRAYGTENVPERGGFMLASNHQSYLDPIFCGLALKRRLHFVARDSLFGNRFFASLIYSLNAIPVRRGQADISTMKTVIRRLKKGDGVCLFPEATRTNDGRIRPFKPGFGLLCRRANAAVVPVLLDGAFECWPRHKKIFSAGQVAVCYGKAITPAQIEEMGDEKLAEHVTRRLRDMQDGWRRKHGRAPHNYE